MAQVESLESLQSPYLFLLEGTPEAGMALDLHVSDPVGNLL